MRWHVFEPPSQALLPYSDCDRIKRECPNMIISWRPSGEIASRQTFLLLTQRSIDGTILRAAPLFPTVIPSDLPLTLVELLKLLKCGCSSENPCATKRCSCKANGL